MGQIKIIHAGEATDEEVRAVLNQQVATPVQEGPHLRAKDIQPRIRAKGLSSIDAVPDMLKEGEQAKPQQVLATALAKHDDNYDLIGECVKLLRLHGAHELQIKAMLSSAIIAPAQKTTTFTQRGALNIFWNQAIGRMGDAGLRYRRNLVSQGTARDWLQQFGNGPVQFIVQFALPIGCGAPMTSTMANMRKKPT